MILSHKVTFPIKVVFEHVLVDKGTSNATYQGTVHTATDRKHTCGNGGQK